MVVDYRDQLALPATGDSSLPALSIKRRVRTSAKRNQDSPSRSGLFYLDRFVSEEGMMNPRENITDKMISEGREQLKSLERSGSSTLELIRIAKADTEAEDVRPSVVAVVARRLSNLAGVFFVLSSHYPSDTHKDWACISGKA
ncbi:hypothetical protein FOZ62_025380 [Perkinsus olseni]|uniref:Uncharacterized protein n=1 Tax=Perkinsus olseni TaxID=32597 RepID=A0A7J6TV38_PEROL|nr:hypothetical protein FOZ62_025380 [Perkinsus olseni]